MAPLTRYTFLRKAASIMILFGLFLHNKCKKKRYEFQKQSEIKFAISKEVFRKNYLATIISFKELFHYF